MSHFIKDRASGLSSQVQHGAERTRDWFTQMIDENPFVMGAAFFTLGIVGGLAIPATKREDRLLGPARDRLMESAQEVGTRLIDKGQETAERAVGAVKEAVSSASGGLPGAKT